MTRLIYISAAITGLVCTLMGAAVEKAVTRTIPAPPPKFTQAFVHGACRDFRAVLDNDLEISKDALADQQNLEEEQNVLDRLSIPHVDTTVMRANIGVTRANTHQMISANTAARAEVEDACRDQ